MIRDLFFVLVVVSATLYASSHKVTILSFIEVVGEEMVCDDKVCVIKGAE